MSRYYPREVEKRFAVRSETVLEMDSKMLWEILSFFLAREVWMG